MSEQNIVTIELTDEQRVAFAAVLRAAHAQGSQRKATIFTVVADSYVPDDKSSVLRLQVAMVNWKVGQKVAKLLSDAALKIDSPHHFT
jgi:hypothetical protein